MKKILVILCFVLLSTSLYAQDLKDKPNLPTKMDAFASKTGSIIKFIDYSLPNIKQNLGGAAETKIRKFISGTVIKCFYQISKKGQYDTKTASIAYEDLLEIIKAIEPLKIESISDLEFNPEYLENKFVTDDGFQIGYYISKGKINWYLTLEKYGSGNTVFIKDLSEIETAFNSAKMKIDELNKR